jgi:cytochrome c556
MKPILSLVLVAAVAAAGPAHVQFAKAEDAVKYRKSVLFVMQQNFGPVAGMAGGKIPFEVKVAAESAAVAEFVSRLPWVAFGDGTDKGDTRAKPEIWKERAKFDEYADKMQAEMVKLSAIGDSACTQLAGKATVCSQDKATSAPSAATGQRNACKRSRARWAWSRQAHTAPTSSAVAAATKMPIAQMRLLPKGSGAHTSKASRPINTPRSRADPCGAISTRASHCRIRLIAFQNG